ncbi:fibronectin type III domain-containing protein [Micromonospora sp. M61]|uniref:fibronectin type III domain-containing protein n=1 Tax=Micromonospora sp. M61 TaxID=2824890 RepID=UPI0035B31AC8
MTQPTATGFTITWGVPTNPSAIERYEVLFWDQDTPNAILSSTGIKGFSARIDGLKPNHRYLISVASWNTTGSGVPNPARPIRVGTTTPTAPTGLQINPFDANTVQHLDQKRHSRRLPRLDPRPHQRQPPDPKRTNIHRTHPRHRLPNLRLLELRILRHLHQRHPRISPNHLPNTQTTNRQLTTN